MSTLRAPDKQAFLHKAPLPSGRASVTALTADMALHGRAVAPIVQFPLNSDRPANAWCDHDFDRPLFAPEIASASPCTTADPSNADRPVIVWLIASLIVALIEAGPPVDRTTVACVAAADRFAQRKARAGWHRYIPLRVCSIGGGSLLIRLCAR